MQLIIRKIGREFFRTLVLATLVFMPLGAASVAADTTWTQTIQADCESGTLSQVDTSSSPGDVKLAKAGSGYIYAFKGNGTRTFWRYDIATNTWMALADAPQNVGAGGALAYDGSNYIYALAGGGNKYFWRYDIAANTWASLALTLYSVNAGGALTFTGNYLYAFRGGSSRIFCQYNIASNTWTRKANTPASVQGGGALTYNGGG